METFLFTFYCNEIAMNLHCELEFDPPDPEVGLKASMTLVGASPEGAPQCDIAPILRQDLIDEIEQAALDEASRPTDRVDSDYV